MAKYLTKFNTSADYNSALFTLDLPNVSAVNGVVTYLTQYPVSDCSWYVTDSSGNVVYGKLASASTVVNTSEIPEEITNGKLYITASATSIQNIAANLSNAEIYGLPSDFLENISVQFMSNYPHEGFDLSNTETITTYTPFQNNTHITTADLRGITTMPSNPIFSGCPNIATVYSPKVAGSFVLGSGFTDTYIYIEPELQQLGQNFINSSRGGTDGVIIEFKYNSEGYGINGTSSNYSCVINNTKIKKLILDRCINGYVIDSSMSSYPGNLIKPNRSAYNNEIEEISFPEHDTHSVYLAGHLGNALKWHLGKTTKFTDYFERDSGGRLSTITCDSENPYYSAANNAILSKDGTIYHFGPYSGSVTIPNTVTTISVGALRYSSMTSLTIPNSVTTIGDGAFRDCTNLATLSIGSGITEIKEEMFNNCTSLTSVTIPNNVTRIGQNVFLGCTGLSTITFGNSVTSIGLNAFLNTAWYNSQSDGLLYMGDWLITHKGHITGSVAITEGTKNIADYALSTIEATSITFPSSVKRISTRCCESTISLTSVTISEGVTTIGAEAFYNSRLTSITIPNSVTTIENDAFNYCIKLTSATIGSGVTNIGANAFYYCEALTSVTINATTPPVLENYNAFSYTNANLVIYVPAESVAAYKAASGWSYYKNKIQAIPSE